MYLIMDQGGQSSRVALFDNSGALLQLNQRPVATVRPKAGWVEQDPLQVVASLQDCLDELVLPEGADIKAALVTQRSSLVCWDRISGEPLSPVLSWQDTRAADLLNSLGLDQQDIRQRTGLYPNAHFGASKMRWCLECIPAVKKAAAEDRLCIAPLSTFLLYQLSPQQPFKADAANASRTMLYNLEKGNWDTDLLHRFGLPESVLPPIESSFANWGSIPVGNVSVDIKFVSGDQSAAFSFLAGGDSDTAVVNAGTGAFIGLPLAEGQKAPERLLQTLLLRENDSQLFIAEGTVNGAGSALHYMAEQLGVQGELELERWWRSPARRPLFLNGVGGLAAPFWDARFQSVFVGEGAAREKMAAVLESIGFLLYCNFQQMQQLGNPIRRVRIAGGLSRIDCLCQLLADLCRLPVHRLELAEATAIGAAWLLAGRPQWPQREDVFSPGENSEVAIERYDTWLKAMENALGPVAV